MDIGITPPDGAEDLERRRKRALEFSNRFSRNYLYQLGRQMTELQKIGKNHSKGGASVSKRFLTNHQIVLQAFQAFYSHMPASIPNSSSDKLKELLTHTVNLCCLHGNFAGLDSGGSGRKDNLLQTVDCRCKSLLERVDESFEATSVVSLLRSTSTRMSLLGYGAKVRKGKQPNSKNAIDARLSMYKMPVGFKLNEQWKRTVAAMARQQLKYSEVQSRYKTATYKHRQPPEKPQEAVVKPDKKMQQQQQQQQLQAVREAVPINEDEIVTMVAVDKEKEDRKQQDEERNEDEEGGDLQAKEDDILNKLRPLVQDFFLHIKKEKKEVTQVQLKSDEGGDAPGQQGVANGRVPTNGADSIEKATRSLLEECLGQPFVENSCSELVEKLVAMAKSKGEEIKEAGKSQKGKKKQTVTVSGAKNAQLICIRDDTSISDVPKKAANGFKPPPPTPTWTRTSTMETQTSDSLERAKEGHKAGESCCLSASSKTSMKISRLSHKQLRPLAMLPKKEALNVIQYKLKYHKHTKTSYMYRKSAKVQPWVILEKISDRLLDDLLLDITREIEVNDILERLYESEFQQ